MNIKTYAEFQADLAGGTLQGLYSGVSNAEYHAAPGLSSTGLREYMTSPAHFRHRLERDEAYNLGAVIHACLLENGTFDKWYFADAALIRALERKWAKDGKKVEKPRATKEYKDARELLEASGRTMVKDADYESAQEIVKRVHADPTASGLLTLPNSHREISGFVTDPLGILLKYRPDILTPAVRIIPDLKSISRGMSERELWAVTKARGWLTQAGFYLYCHHLLTGEQYEWCFLFVETKPPNAIRIRTVPQEMIDRAQGWFLPYLPEYKKHLARDEWPPFPSDPKSLWIPDYALADDFGPEGWL